MAREILGLQMLAQGHTGSKAKARAQARVRKAILGNDAFAGGSESEPDGSAFRTPRTDPGAGLGPAETNPSRWLSVDFSSLGELHVLDRAKHIGRRASPALSSRYPSGTDLPGATAVPGRGHG